MPKLEQENYTMSEKYQILQKQIKNIKDVIKELSTKIQFLREEKERHFHNFILIKSAYSVVEDMFMEEMDNANKIRKTFESEQKHLTQIKVNR